MCIKITYDGENFDLLISRVPCENPTKCPGNKLFIDGVVTIVRLPLAGRIEFKFAIIWLKINII